MGKITCFGVASIVLDEITEKNTGRYVEVPRERGRIAEICAGFDELCDKFEAKSFSVDVDEAMNVVMEVECEDLEAKIGDGLFGLTAAAQTFSIRVSDEDKECVKIRFVFDGIWRKDE